MFSWLVYMIFLSQLQQLLNVSAYMLSPRCLRSSVYPKTNSLLLDLNQQSMTLRLSPFFFLPISLPNKDFVFCKRKEKELIKNIKQMLKTTNKEITIINTWQVAQFLRQSFSLRKHTWIVNIHIYILHGFYLL